MSSHIPLPRLALNIGISGHRPNKLTAAQQKLAGEKFRKLADRIADEVRSILRKDAGLFYADDPPLIRIVTGLAEGADRLVLANRPTEWIYEAILPLPRSEYARDFNVQRGGQSSGEFDALLAGAASVTELPLQADSDPSEPEGRAASYAALGDFLVHQIDLLVTIWDGKPAEGRGGTAEVIDKALGLGLPIVWLNLQPEPTPSLIKANEDSDSGHEIEVLGDAKLSHLLANILAPPQPATGQRHHSHDGHDHQASDRHGDEHHATSSAPPEFLKTAWPRASYLPFAYSLLRKLCGAGRMSWPIRYGSLAEQLKSWSPFFSAIEPADHRLSENLAASLLPSSIWADALAWYYGQIYRSAYVSVFILASLSVPIGLCYLFFLSSPAVLHIKAGFVVIELLIISTVVIVVRRGVASNWHGQWLQTRKLSELLRLGRNLAYVGASRSFIPAPGPGQSEDFSDWYVRANFRECGLPNAVLDPSYLRVVLMAVSHTEIAQQRSYHRGNASNLNKIHHVLHRLGDVSFIATVMFLLVYLVAWGGDSIYALFSTPPVRVAEAGGESVGGWFHEALEFVIKPIVSIAAAGLPAFGAAITGIREQGDFEGFAERSQSTQLQLSAVGSKISQLIDDQDKLNLRKAQDILLLATQVMAKDVSAWHEQYSSKRLSLPA